MIGRRVIGEPERGLTPNGVVARDGDGGGEFIERDMATERSADGDARMANPDAKVGSLDYAHAVTSTKGWGFVISLPNSISLQTWR